MKATFSTPNNFWMARNALTISLNALGNPDYVLAAVSSGSVIMVFVEGVISYDSGHNYRKWFIQAFPTVLENKKERFVYARIPNQEKINENTALIVYSPTLLSLYGEVSDNSGNIVGEQATDPMYYYIYLGHISDSTKNNREWLNCIINDGKLSTDQFIREEPASEWKKIFSVDTVLNLINPLLPFSEIITKKLRIGADKKVITDIKRSVDNDVAVSDENLATSKYVEVAALSSTKDDEAEGVIHFKNGLKVAGRPINGVCVSTDKYSPNELTVPTTQYLESHQLSKEHDDVSKGHVRFEDGISTGLSTGANIDREGNFRGQSAKSRNFATGLVGGSGFVLEERDGVSFLEVDKLSVRMKAIFAALEIRKIKYSGGNFIFGPAALECVRVETQSDFYRCYFRNKDKEGAKIGNEFRVDDLVRCQEFNPGVGVQQNVSNHFLWRRCVAVGEDYIDLSSSDCARGSDAPREGDTLVTLGNKTKADRQKAIIISAYGEGAPSIAQYDSINDYTLKGKEKTLISPTLNKFTGEFRFSAGDKTVEEHLNDTNNKITETISQLAEANQFINAVNDDLQKAKEQMDGSIETWFLDPEPTLQNAPAVDWTTETLLKQHIGDLYYSKSGLSYRFQKVSNGYEWVQITDDAISKALAMAKEAQDTADGKRTVFVNQPKPPYQEGDLWVGATMEQYKDDLLRCKIPKNSGELFSLSDWIKASGYTDDSKANEAVKAANDAAEAAKTAGQTAEEARLRLKSWADDKVISPVEKQSVRDEHERIDADYSHINEAYRKYSLGVPALFNAAYTSYASQLANLSAKNSETITIPEDFSTNQANYYNERTACLNAIADATKSYAEQQAAKVQVGGRNLIRNSAHVVIEQSQLNWNSKSFYPTERIQSNKDYVLSVDSIKVLSGNPKGVSVFLFDLEHTGNEPHYYAKAVLEISDRRGHVLLHTSAIPDSKNLVVVIYCGIGGETAGNSIELNKIKFEEGNRPSSWTEAPEETQENIQLAQDAAGKAQKDATDANKKLADWANDKLITPDERPALKRELVNITAEKQQINDACGKYGIGTPTDYNTAFTAYSTQLDTLSSSTNDSDPVPGTFESNQTAYYTQRTVCLNAIADATKDYAKQQADNIQFGGRNLLRKSEKLTLDNLQEAKYFFEAFTPTLKIKPNTDYVFSIDESRILKGSATRFTVLIYDLTNNICNGRSEILISEDRQTAVIHTDNFSSDKRNHLLIYCGLSGFTEGNSIAYSRFKLEEGNRPSSWTEAPEDTRENIRLAQEAADNAGTVAKGAADRLESWSKDGVISPNEKQAIRTEDINITQEKEQILSAYTKYGLEEPTVYITVYGNYHQNLVAMSAKEPEVITIPSVFAANQQEYYHQRTLCLNAISEATKHYAEQQAANVQVGGRNLVLDSEKGISGTYDSKFYDLNTTWKAMTGKEVTISFDYVYENLNTPPESDDSQRIGVEASIATKNGQNYDVRAWLFFYNNKKNLNGRGRFKRTAFVPTDIVDDNNVIGAHIQLPGSTATLVKVDHIKVEFGNKATDWTPAVEDIERNVNLAKEAADKAQKDADDANKKLTDWANDKLITPDERPSLKRELVNITAEKQQINDAYGKYGLGTPTDYNAAFKAYSKQLDTLSSSTNDSDPVPDTFESNQTAYYTQRTACLNAIADGTKKYSETLVGNVSVGGRNIIRNSKELTIEESQHIWNNKIFETTERIRSNTDYVFSVESTKVLKGNPEGITVFLFDLYYKEGETMAYASGVLDISNEKRYVLLHTGTIPDDKNLVLVVYSGIGGDAQGKSVQFTKLKLEEGNKPTAWSEAPEDVLLASYNYTDSIIEATEKSFATKFEGVQTDIRGWDEKLNAEIKDRKSAIKQTQDGITTTVESSIRELEIGGRNIVLESKEGISGVYANKEYSINEPWKNISGRKVTISFDYAYEGLNTGDSDRERLGVEAKILTQSGENYSVGAWIAIERNKTGLNGSGRGKNTVTVPDNIVGDGKSIGAYIQLDGSTAQRVSLDHIKVEFGNKATDWAPAIEDTDAKFEGQGELIQKNITAIEQTNSAIIETVKSVSKIDGRLNEAELQITKNSNGLESNVRRTTELGEKTGNLEKTSNGINHRLVVAESTIKQLPDQIKLEVSSIEVGGRNYLTNSSLEEQEDWKINDPIHAAFTTSQYGKCLVSYAKSAGAYKYIDKPVSSNVYVSSVDVFSQDGGKHSIYLGMELPDNSFLKEYDLTPGTWTRISNVQILDSERRAFIIYGDDSMLLFRNAQLEAGNKPTSWKESSEDTEEKLLKTGIDIKNGQIDVTADKFKVQDSKGTPVAVFTTENGKPQIKAENIQADNIIASRLISTGTDGTKTEVIGGIFSCFAPNSPTPGIKIGIDADGDLVFKFYDKNGKETFNFGPKGPLEIRTPYMDAVRMALITSVDSPTYQNVIESIKNPTAETFYQYQSGTLEGIGDSSKDGHYYETDQLVNQVPAGVPIRNGWYTLNLGEPFYIKVDSFDRSVDICPSYAQTGQYYYMRNIFKVINGGASKIGSKILMRHVYWQ